MQDLAHFALDAGVDMRDMPRLVALYDKASGTTDPTRLPRLQLCLFMYHLGRFAAWCRWDSDAAPQLWKHVEVDLPVVEAIWRPIWSNPLHRQSTR